MYNHNHHIFSQPKPSVNIIKMVIDNKKLKFISNQKHSDKHRSFNNNNK